MGKLALKYMTLLVARNEMRRKAKENEYLAITHIFFKHSCATCFNDNLQGKK